jgi:mevalonate pyrophosphate decarboxylase
MKGSAFDALLALDTAEEDEQEVMEDARSSVSSGGRSVFLQLWERERASPTPRRHHRAA